MQTQHVFRKNQTDNFSSVPLRSSSFLFIRHACSHRAVNRRQRTPARPKFRRTDKSGTRKVTHEEVPEAIDLCGRKIKLRHQRHHNTAVVVYDGERRASGRHLLDVMANGLAQRKDSQASATTKPSRQPHWW